MYRKPLFLLNTSVNSKAYPKLFHYKVSNDKKQKNSQKISLQYWNKKCNQNIFSQIKNVLKNDKKRVSKFNENRISKRCEKILISSGNMEE